MKVDGGMKELKIERDGKESIRWMNGQDEMGREMDEGMGRERWMIN